jgi:hypothetical protein
MPREFRVEEGVSFRRIGGSELCEGGASFLARSSRSVHTSLLPHFLAECMRPACAVAVCNY